MYKSSIALTVFALTAFAARQQQDAHELRLKAEKMILEYSATQHTAAVRVEAESEQGLTQVEIRGPSGARVLEMKAGTGHALALSGFKLESQEFRSSMLLANYPAGRYMLSAETTDGREAWGSAVLSHALPRAPVVLHPRANAQGVPTNLVCNWVPVPEAKGYTIDFEQDENDGLSVKLPAGTEYFQVPRGVLAGGTPTHLELAAIGANGNRTLVEVSFTTR